MRRALFAAMAAALLSTTPAFAAADPGKFYVGGHLSPGSAPKAIVGSVLVQMVTAADGASTSLYFEGSLTCGRALAGAKAIPVAADGAFTSTATDTDTRNRVRYTTAYSINGRFDGRNASGTMHIDLTTLARGRTKKCSRDLAFNLREEPNGQEQFTPGPPRPGTQYFGGIGDGHPFVLRTDATGANIAMAGFTYRMKCRRGSVDLNEFTPRIKVKADRTFTLTERWTERYSNGTDKFTVKIKGVFVEGNAAGSAQVTSVFRDKRKRVRDRCKTKVMPFFATV